MLTNEGNPEGMWGITREGRASAYLIEVIRHGSITFLHEPKKPFFLAVDQSRNWRDATEVYQCCSYSGSQKSWDVGVDEYLELRATRGSQSIGVVDAKVRERRAEGTLFLPELAPPCLATVLINEVDKTNLLSDSRLHEQIEVQVMKQLRLEMKSLHWDDRKLAGVSLGPVYKQAKSIFGRFSSKQRGVGTQYFTVFVDLRQGLQLSGLFIRPPQDLVGNPFGVAKGAEVTELNIHR
ncbi:MAG: hypothetical protein ABI972_02290 [Acidobacteriota bacterium]